MLETDQKEFSSSAQGNVIKWVTIEAMFQKGNETISDKPKK